MTLKITGYYIIAILISTTVFGQKYSNEFLQLGAGSRALAMGNAVVSSSDNIFSGYWNPSGLLHLKNNITLGLMHSSYFGGLAKYDFGATAIKYSDSSAFCLSVLRFGVDDIPNTLDIIDANGNIDLSKLRSFSVADYAVLLSYARRFNKIPNIYWGTSIKIIRRIVGEFASAWGFGFDISASYSYNAFKFGATLRDATSTFNAWSYNTETFANAFIKTGNEIPKNGIEITRPRLIIGTAYEFKFNEKLSLLSEINNDFTFDGKRNTIIKSSFTSIDPHIGIELSYLKKFFIRTGVYNVQRVININGKEVLNVQPSIGAGIIHKSFSIDYAFTDVGNASVALYSHVISVSFGLDRK